MRKRYEREFAPVVYAYAERGLKGRYAYVGSTSNMKRRELTRMNGGSGRCRFDLIYRERPQDFKLVILRECATSEEARHAEMEIIHKLCLYGKKPKYNSITYPNFGLK